MGHTITLPCVIKAKHNETISISYDDSYRDFKYLIEEYMGYEALKVFEEILQSVEEETDRLYAEGLRHPNGDDYEAISDGYRGLLIDTMNDLHEVLYGKNRISRKRLEEIHNRLNKEV